MKHRLKIFSSIVLLIIMMCQCDWLMEKDYPLYMMNNADFTTSWYLALGGDEGTRYPDTTLPSTDKWVIYNVSSKTKHQIGFDFSIEELFSMQPRDTMSVFVFHADTLSKYSWEEVRDGYKILERYDLSYDDLERMDWTITYP